MLFITWAQAGRQIRINYVADVVFAADPALFETSIQNNKKAYIS